MVPGNQGQARALRREAASEFEPEPGRAASDDDALIAKTEHGVPPASDAISVRTAVVEWQVGEAVARAALAARSRRPAEVRQAVR